VRAGWIVAAPLALYGIWWLAYQDSELIRHAIVLTPNFVAGAFAGALSSLVGLSGHVVPEEGASLNWGRPLAVAAVALLAFRLVSLRTVSPRVLALLTILLAFWLSTGVRRSFLSDPDASRYVYVGGLFIVLLTVELARGVRMSALALVLLACAVGAAVLSNVGILRDAGRHLRLQGEQSRAALGAVELTRDIVPADHVVTALPGYPFVTVRAGPYLEAADELGSPAADPATSGEQGRLAADAELTRIHGITLRPAAAALPRGASPAVDVADGGSARSAGGCVAFRPDPFVPTGAVPVLDLTVPPEGVLVTTLGGSTTVRLRRFAGSFPTAPLGSLEASASAALRPGADPSPLPWHVRLEPQGRLRVCGLR
jgi:hypothetical protein